MYKNGVQCVQPACLADVAATLHGQVPMNSELCGVFCLQKHRTLICIDCGLASRTAEKAAARDAAAAAAAAAATVSIIALSLLVMSLLMPLVVAVTVVVAMAVAWQ